MHEKLRAPEIHHRHVAIDPFQSTVWDSVGKMKLAELGLLGTVQIFEEKSSFVLPRLLEQGRRFGIIYVDGSHLFEDVFIDAYYSARLLEPDGYLLFDDSTDPHIKKVLAFINTSVTSLERQAEGTFRHTVARMLGRKQLTVYRRRGAVEREWNAAFHSF
jgi:hypothetical protein